LSSRPFELSTPCILQLLPRFGPAHGLEIRGSVRLVQVANQAMVGIRF
jgi:hypothetical protein